MRKIFVLIVFCFSAAFLYGDEDVMTEGPVINQVIEDVEKETEKEAEVEFEKEAEPELQKETEKTTSIIIKTDVPGADVFLNGVYYGRTKLEIEDLNPGFYHLELRKKGYEKEHFYIKVRKGYSVTYFFKLRKIFGIISLENLPSDTRVYLNGINFAGFTSGVHSYDSKVAKVDPGFYEVKVRKFGFKDFVAHVNVRPYETVRVQIEMQEADFVLDNFTVLKERFNPAYKNHLGQTEFTFYVTKSEPVVAVIENEAGETVYSCNWNHFSTWKNTFVWNGKNIDDEALPDGKYTAIISGGDYTCRVSVQLDSSIVYPVMFPTFAGGGIGNLPALFSEDSSYFMSSLQLSSVVSLSPVFEFSAFDVNASLLWNFLQHCEISLNASVFPAVAYSDGLIHVGGAFKLYSKIPLTSEADFCYGAILRYGYSDVFLYENVIDTGNGLGGGLLFNVNLDMCNFGFSSQYLFGARDGILDSDDELWINGITASLKLSDATRINGWCALNSYSRVFKPLNQPEFFWFNGLDAGFEMLFMPKSTSAVFDFKVGVKTFFNEKACITGNLGAAFLF